MLATVGKRAKKGIYMAEKLITAKQLGKLIGLSSSTMNVQLAIFNKYMVQNGARYFYKLNYYFLRDLKKFYEKKMKKTRNQIHSVKYYKIIFNIKKLMETI